jgi:hypothetical protein
MSIGPARKLVPYVYATHRRDDLPRYVSFVGALPDGVTITHATVEWSQRVDEVRVDRTALFGSPVVVVNPPTRPGSGGGTVGGPGTLLFEPDAAPNMPRGLYDMLLTVTFSSLEVVTYGGVDDVTVWGEV